MHKKQQWKSFLVLIAVLMLVLSACDSSTKQADLSATEISLVKTQTALEVLQSIKTNEPSSLPAIEPPAATEPPVVEPAATEPPASEDPSSDESLDYTTLRSGDLIYYTDFNSIDDWDGWAESPNPSSNTGYELYLEASNLVFDIDDPETEVFAIPGFIDFPRDYADMFVEAYVYNAGTNTINNISVLCRVSENGFYEFSLLSGGLWYIWKYTPEKDFQMLTNGGLADFDYYAPHVIAGLCEGDTLTIYIDGEIPKNGTIKDRTFREGGVGVAVYSGNGNVLVEVDEFAVSVP